MYTRLLSRHWVRHAPNTHSMSRPTWHSYFHDLLFYVFKNYGSRQVYIESWSSIDKCIKSCKSTVFAKHIWFSLSHLVCFLKKNTEETGFTKYWRQNRFCNYVTRRIHGIKLHSFFIFDLCISVKGAMNVNQLWKPWSNSQAIIPAWAIYLMVIVQ